MAKYQSIKSNIIKVIKNYIQNQNKIFTQRFFTFITTKNSVCFKNVGAFLTEYTAPTTTIKETNLLN